MSKIKIFITLIVTVLAIGLLPQQAFADPLGQITPYATSARTGNRLVETSDNKIWAVDKLNDKFVVFDKSAQQTTLYNSPVDDLDNLTYGPDGNIWYTYLQSTGSIGKVGKITSTGTRTEYTIPQRIAGDTQPATTIVAGPDGRIWLNKLTLKQDNSYPQQDTYKPSIIILNTDGSLHKRIEYGTELPENSTDNNIARKLVTDYENDIVWEVATVRDNSIATVQLNKLTSDGQRTNYTIPSTTEPGLPDITIGPDGKLWFIAYSYDLDETTTGSIDTSGNLTSSMLPTSAPNCMGCKIATGHDGNLWITSPYLSKFSPTAVGEERISQQNFYTVPDFTPNGPILGGSDGNIWIGLSNGNQIYKIGTGSNPSSSDIDNDGLILEKETLQHTSDNVADTDSDGLNDYTESQWNTQRNDLFCNGSATICEYPTPLQKDIYIEVDWMTRPAQGSNPAYETKPSNSEIQEIKSAFAAKSINAHFDTGQLGGGNEVDYVQNLPMTPTDNTVDFYDIKKGGDSVTAQFAQDRDKIYHYLISGHEFLEVPGSSGAALPGDDDFFVSYGLLKDNYSGNFSTAISGTVMHELGHNLCLTNSTTEDYPGQPSTCRFAGIDTLASSDYESVMNYTYQKTMVDYSMGSNGVNDHDDWNALRPQDFVNSNQGDIEHGAMVALQKKYKNNRNALKQSPEFKKLQKDIDKLKRKIQHNHAKPHN